MKLNPFPEQSNKPTLVPAPSANVLSMLESAGIQPRSSSKRNDFQMLLDHRGASLDEVATALANSLQDDKQRLNAAKLIMEAHGLTEQKAVAQIPNITIIIGEKNSSKGILDLVSPNLATA